MDEVKETKYLVTCVNAIRSGTCGLLFTLDCKNRFKQSGAFNCGEFIVDWITYITHKDDFIKVTELIQDNINSSGWVTYKVKK
jgi:hypothetical protein